MISLTSSLIPAPKSTFFLYFHQIRLKIASNSPFICLPVHLLHEIFSKQIMSFSDAKTHFSLPRLYSVKSLPTLRLRHVKGQLSEELLQDRREERGGRRLKTWMTSRPEPFLPFSLKSTGLSAAECPDSQIPRALLASPVHVKTTIGSVQSVRKTHNQDSFFDQTQANCRVIGICDGHGTKGHLVSRYVAKQLPMHVFEKLENGVNLDSAVFSAFDHCAELLKSSKHDFQTSGCACLALFFTVSHLLCASLGHARAVTARLINGIWSVFQLSSEHRPDQEPELSRILGLGGEVAVSKRMHTGPARVYIKGTDYPGLCISRALGDTSVQAIGVLHEPEIAYFQPTSMDKFLLLATFGLWEVIGPRGSAPSSTALELSPESVPGALVLEAQRRWKERGALVDDITVVLVMLD